MGTRKIRAEKRPASLADASKVSANMLDSYHKQFVAPLGQVLTRGFWGRMKWLLTGR